jgi:hypothetical protein
MPPKWRSVLADFPRGGSNDRCRSRVAPPPLGLSAAGVKFIQRRLHRGERFPRRRRTRADISRYISQRRKGERSGNEGLARPRSRRISIRVLLRQLISTLIAPETDLERRDIAGMRIRAVSISLNSAPRRRSRELADLSRAVLVSAKSKEFARASLANWKPSILAKHSR